MDEQADGQGRDGVQLRDLTAITLFVEDLAAARAFYPAVFGRPVVHSDEHSVVIGLGDVLVNLLQVQAAPELVEPGTVAGPGGHRFMLTVQVADVDAVCAALAQRGVTLRNGPQDRPWGIRTAAFTDPAGHLWEVAGPLR